MIATFELWGGDGPCTTRHGIRLVAVLSCRSLVVVVGCRRLGWPCVVGSVVVVPVCCSGRRPCVGSALFKSSSVGAVLVPNE